MSRPCPVATPRAARSQSSGRVRRSADRFREATARAPRRASTSSRSPTGHTERCGVRNPPHPVRTEPRARAAAPRPRDALAAKRFPRGGRGPRRRSPAAPSRRGTASRPRSGFGPPPPRRGSRPARGDPPPGFARGELHPWWRATRASRLGRAGARHPVRARRTSQPAARVHGATPDRRSVARRRRSRVGGLPPRVAAGRLGSGRGSLACRPARRSRPDPTAAITSVSRSGE